MFDFVHAQYTKLDFIALTETWLDESVNSAEMFSGDYDIFRCDRQRSVVGLSRGGGVLLAVKSSLKACQLDLKVSCPLFDSVPLIDIVGIKLICASKSLNIFVVYVPPRITIEESSIFFEALESLLIKYSGESLIIGDFNISRYADSLAHPTQDRNVRMLNNFCSLFDLKQNNYITNVGNRILDLVLTVRNCVVEGAEDVIVNEDEHHPALYMKLSGVFDAQRSVHTCSRALSSYNFKLADIPSLYDYISQISWDSVLTESDVDASVNALYSKLYSALDNFVPKTKPFNKSQYPPWFTPDIKRKLRSKHYYWRQHKKFGDQDAYQNFRKLRAEVKRDLHIAHVAFVQRTENKINSDPKKFWSFINSKTTKHSFPENVTYQGKNVSDAEEVVETFGKYFADSFVTSDHVLESCTARSSDSITELLSIACISDGDILAGFKRIKPNFSAGPDLLPGFLLVDCRFPFLILLRHILNLIVKKCYFPVKWKTSRTVPVFKKGDRVDVSNYRPIAILNNFCKVIEFCLHKQIMEKIKGSLSEHQHGFVPGRSTVTNLFVATQYISDHLDSSSQVDVVYTDFSKAFDHINHNILLNKLKRFNFSNHLVQLIRSYLSNRVQYVENKGIRSQVYCASSGVPQGSILGPLLFNVFIDDIVSKLSVPCLLYADDVKIYQSISTIDDCIRLQQNLDALCSWCYDNHLNLNTSKCFVKSFYRVKGPVMFQYSIMNEILSRPNFVKDLGVLFDSQLTFTPHIETIIQKCHKCLGFIIRNAKNFSCDTLLKLFYVYIRSRLEYGCLIWSPTYSAHIKDIEAVQRKFLKYLAFKLDGSYPVVGYPHELLLQRFAASSFEQRRDYHSVMFLYKILSSQIDCRSISQQIVFNTNRSGTRHQTLFYLPFARTRAQQSSPLYRMCRSHGLIQDKVDILHTSCDNIKSAFFDTAKNR